MLLNIVFGALALRRMCSAVSGLMLTMVGRVLLGVCQAPLLEPV